jgi:Phage integrase family
VASLYTRRRSPYWWIKFRDPIDGLEKRESSGYRVGVGNDTRKAREFQAEKTLAERRLSAKSQKEVWDIWVPPLLDQRYQSSKGPPSAGSHLRYCVAWRTLRLFLNEHNIALPRQLTRIHCLSYPKWRETPNKHQGKYRAGHNTALTELKLLGLLMKEAVISGFASANPCRELGMKRGDAKLRPEYSDEELDQIVAAIAKEPEPKRTIFANSFWIARYHGVRISETYLNPMTDIDLWQEKKEIRGLVRFKQKGSRLTTKPLHPKLIPLFQQLRAAGATETYPRPKSLSKEWFNFLHRCGIKDASPDACFHSLRVTVASRMARNNISQRKAMEYLTHASTTVHQAYVRWRPEDVAECHDAV